MRKEKKSGDKETGSSHTTDSGIDENPSKATAENPPADDASSAEVSRLESNSEQIDVPVESPVKPETGRRVGIFFGILNLLLIIALIVVAVYYWKLQQKTEIENQQIISKLNRQLANKADSSKLNSAISAIAPLKSEIGQAAGNIERLQQQQKDLQAASEELYDLYGRNENGWKLAEVEYLMRTAQHKLILQNDFAGAALTLQAASDGIAATADTGLLPVRVKISEEIATLKTRSRPDLVGMTLLLSQLGQQLHSLKPGFETASEPADSIKKSGIESSSEQSIYQRMVSFLTSLVRFKHQPGLPTLTESLVINIEDTLADNLKLTRWAVLERDSYQFGNLMKDNLNLFKQFYNLDDAANNDFYRQLLHLNKTIINPEKPDISGSLNMLKQIVKQRELAPIDVTKEDASDV